MCGIAGIVDLEATREIDRDALKRMSAALIHRGPDGEGVFIAPGVGFTHRRLAIIDREGGAQPFKILSRKGVLNYNGEIYNYQTLSKMLSEKGVALSTRSDVETLAEGFALEGRHFIDKLRGMFAFAFWDVTDEVLTLCRDRLGEKPLYYAQTKDGFLVFASEVGAIARSGLVSLDLDDQAAADYFLYGFVPDPKSVFAYIRKLPPGAMLTAARGGEPALESYWRPDFGVSENIRFEDAEEQLLALLDDATRAEMNSDVPLGAFLSGGLDSSAIIASMKRAGGAIKTCSIGFEEDSHDERPYARIVAKLYDADHVEDIARIDTAGMIDEIARVYGEPFADPSALPTYMVAKLARQCVTVSLSGDGGDEIFAGYRRYSFFVNEERLRAAAPLPLRQATFGPAGAVYPKLDWAPRPVRLKTTLQSLAQSRSDAYAHAIAANLPDRVRRMLSRDLKKELGDYRPESAIAEAMNNIDDAALVSAQRADLAVWLPGRILTKIDRASMAHGLEVRPPLLDIPLVEWACKLDSRFKLQNGEGKRIFKAALKERLPPEIIDRKKQGFALPLARWMRETESPIRRLTESPYWRQSGYLNPRAVDAMARAHAAGVADCSQELWSVIMFDAFLKNASGFARA